MHLTEIGTDEQSLQACAELMRSAFPDASHLRANYLKWLYLENPAGPVVGYNAWEESKVVGHYAAIPVELWLDGVARNGLLALNTAMHPEYRNAGIIYSLANRTLRLAEQRGFDCVYAVANAASTPIMLKALGFQMIDQLTAGIGPCRLQIDWRRAVLNNRFRRRWTAGTASWRAANPNNPSRLIARDGESVFFRAKTPMPGLFAHGVIPIEPPLPECDLKARPGLNLFLGLMPAGSFRLPGYIPIPDRLKPSPLNLIYRPLSPAAPGALTREETILGIHDFDPY